MFDFRYHATSLAAVFLALAVGLLLGIAVGDRQLVSTARNKLEDNLKDNLAEAQAETERLRAELTRQRLYEQQTFPLLVADRLAGRRVAVVFLHGRSEGVFEHVRDAVTAAGGEVATSYSVRETLDLEDVGSAAAGTRWEMLAADPTLLEPFAERIGTQIVQPGRLLRQVRRAVMSASGGELQGAEAIVVVHGHPGEHSDEELERMEGFETALAVGLGALRTPVVGVEMVETDPSQIPWYRSHDMASVDNVDQAPGRASLVYALAGTATGSYGVKRTRDAFVPDALTRGP